MHLHVTVRIICVVIVKLCKVTRYLNFIAINSKNGFYYDFCDYILLFLNLKVDEIMVQISKHSKVNNIKCLTNNILAYYCQHIKILSLYLKRTKS